MSTPEKLPQTPDSPPTGSPPTPPAPPTVATGLGGGKGGPRHEIYVPGYRLAKLGLALLGVVLVGLSLEKFGPLAGMAVSGGSATAEAVAIVKTDAAGQETVYSTDAEVLAAVKVVGDMRDRETVFWVKYRFNADGRMVEVRSPLGQHGKPLQPLKDSDGLPSTIRVWYERGNPLRVAHPFLLGTWFMPGMLAMFGLLGLFMGVMLWWYADKPIEMPDLSRSHGEG